MRKVVLILFLLLILMEAQNSQGSLKFVSVIIRHGARSPLRTIKELEHTCSWPTGFGELTPSGQRQHYLLGSFLRDKYMFNETLLRPKYNSSEIHFRSTHVHRTIMSTESLAFGLYPDGLDELNEKQNSNEEIWKPPTKLNLPKEVIEGLGKRGMPFNVPPIPVTNFLIEHDRLLLFESCPLYMYYVDSYYDSESFNNTRNKYIEDLNKACELLNVTCKDAQKEEVFYYADYFIAGEFDGQLPILSEKPDLVTKLLMLYFEILVGEASVNPIMNNIAMHDFSKVFSSHFDNAIKGNTKMVVYGTHDITIISYLIALGIDKKEYETVPYASNIIIELRQNAENKYTVHFLFNGKKLFEEDKDDFIKRVKEIGKLDEGWDKVCNVSKEAMVTQKQVARNSLMSVILISLGLIGLVGMLILYMCKRPTNNKDNLRNL